jgi:uncharacterized OsmC-like protein
MSEGATNDAVAADHPDERIRTALRRAVATLEARPGRALGTARTRIRAVDGMTCEVNDGDWELTIDLPARWGGNDRGPNPGVYGRAALGACLAMAYRRWAAENDLPIRALDIEIEADYDARGELGMAEVTPAYTQVRYIVSVETDASPEEVHRVFDLAEERCPYLHVWQDPLDVRRELRIEAS